MNLYYAKQLIVCFQLKNKFFFILKTRAIFQIQNNSFAIYSKSSKAFFFIYSNTDDAYSMILIGINHTSLLNVLNLYLICNKKKHISKSCSISYFESTEYNLINSKSEKNFLLKILLWFWRFLALSIKDSVETKPANSLVVPLG